MTISFKIVPGSTLLIPSGPTPNHHHLFISLTNPIEYFDSQYEYVLLVNISSIYSNIPYDKSCILDIGDHPFIKRNSYILYSKARISKIDSVLKNIQNGKFIPKIPIDKKILDKICYGLETSPHVSPQVKNFYIHSKGLITI